MATSHSFKKTYHNFYEKQRFRNPKLYWTVAILMIIGLYMSFEQVLAKHPIGLYSFTTSGFVYFTLLIPTPVILALVIFRFETVINEDGVFYRWLPFRKNYHMFQWDSVNEVTLVEIDSPWQLFKESKKYREMNYLGGKVGVLFKMKSGSQRMFTTFKAEELNHKLIRIAGAKYKPSYIGQDRDFSD